MAIKIPAYSFRGLTVTDAYARVEHMTGGKRVGAQWRGLVKVYSSAAAANPPAVKVGEDIVDGKPVDRMLAPEAVFLEEIAISAPWVSGGVPEAELYAALKADPRAAGATDV
jgi:hypothetical protein